jgi:hypothetical protein
MTTSFQDLKPFIKRPGGGIITWTHMPGDTYLVTGVMRDGRRFRIPTDNWHYAQAINLWRGSKWLVRDGKRHRILAVYN